MEIVLLNYSKFSAVQLWISAVSEKIRTEAALIFSSENFCFQRCTELNQRCSEIFSYWTALKQTWKYSESELISAECLWDVNPGKSPPKNWNLVRDKSKGSNLRLKQSTWICRPKFIKRTKSGLTKYLPDLSLSLDSVKQAYVSAGQQFSELGRQLHQNQK